MRVHGDSRVQAVGAKEEWIDLHAAVFRPPGRAMFDTLDNSLPHLAPKGIISSNSGITDSRIGVVSRGAFCSSIPTVRFVAGPAFSWKYNRWERRIETIFVLFNFFKNTKKKKQAEG